MHQASMKLSGVFLTTALIDNPGPNAVVTADTAHMGKKIKLTKR